MRNRNYLIVVAFILTIMFLPVMIKFICLSKITIKVIDDTGKPVGDARIEIAFKSGHLRKDAIQGSSNQNGKYSVASRTTDGSIICEVSKDGYYPSGFSHYFIIKKFGLWFPWNKEIRIRLRPIQNPVPMYVRNHRIVIPILSKDISYDLIKSDWVHPYGTGTSSDFIFRIEKNYKSITEFDATLTMTFQNKFDGIQVVKNNVDGIYEGSIFRLHRMAFDEGYQQKLVKKYSEGSTGYRRDHADDNNYIFRVRSEVDHKGKIKQAMYGKILGDIVFDPINSETASITMHYYLNPDYTRNLEFDPQRNLASPLEDGEKVALP